jgi:hypothetical protein
LGCTVATLTRRRLCRRQGAAEPQRTADEDVRDIAVHFGIDAEQLRRVVEGAG